MVGSPPHRGRRPIAFEVSDVERHANMVSKAGGAMLGQLVTRIVPCLGETTFTYVIDPKGNIAHLQIWKKYTSR